MQHYLEAALRNVALIDIGLNVVFLYILILLRHNHRANMFLGLFVVCCASPLLFFVAPIENETLKGVFICLTSSLMTVSGAFMYLYISFLSGDIALIGRKELRHLALFPVILCIMLLLYFPLDPVSHSPRYPRILSAIGPVLILFMMVYAALTFLKVRSYSRRVENWFSDLGKVSMDWLMAISFPSIMLFLIWVFFSMLVRFGIMKWEPAFIMPQLLIIGLIPLIAIFYVIRQPEIFKANREMCEYDAGNGAEEVRSRGKYAKQSVDEEMLNGYRDTLLRCMDVQKPFLDEELTIGHLSMITNIPVHHLSIVINSMFEKNFSTFINEYRIRNAVASMTSEPGANILSVAFKSGFNSKSAFNKIFKKVTGKTPSEYRETIEADSR